MDVLEVENLIKVYGKNKNTVHALKGISFSVAEGEIFGILGVNGAGKSTTMNIMIGLLTASTGSVRIFGKNFFQNEGEIKQHMNIATAYADLASTLTVQQNLNVYGVMYGVKNYRGKIDELLKRFDIERLRGEQFSKLSAGQKTRVNLCKALLNDPEILLLDEPTASLDPSVAANVRELLLSMQRRRRLTVVLTSHNMPEVEEMCDRVALLHQGLIYMTDTPENLVKHHETSDLEAVFIKLAKGELEE